MVFRIFIQHADYGAQSTIAATFAVLGIPVYSTLANYAAKVPKGALVVPPYETHPAHFQFYLSACNIVVLSDKTPEEGHLILDLLERRSFVGHVFLVSNCLTWANSRPGAATVVGSAADNAGMKDAVSTPAAGPVFIDPRGYAARRAVPEMEAVKFLEDRLAGLLVSQYNEEDPLQPNIRGTIISHGLLYDAYTAEGNPLMELVDYVVEKGVLPMAKNVEQCFVPVSSCSRVAIELRNFLQNTVEQGVNLQNVCPFRFVVDEIVPLSTLVSCINEGVYGYCKLEPRVSSKLELLASGLSPRIISYFSMRVTPKPDPLDDFSHSNAVTYTNYQKSNDVVLESLQQILTANTITETPHLFESVCGYITLSVSRRRPRYTVVLLEGNVSLFCDEKVQHLSSALKTPAVTLSAALQGLALLEDAAKEASFWADILDKTDQAVAPPPASAKGTKGGTEQMALEDKAALIVRLVHNLSVTGSTTAAILASAAAAAHALQLKGFVVSIFMLYLRLYAIVGEGYILRPKALPAYDLVHLFTTPLEAFLAQMIIDPALVSDKKGTPKGEMGFATALLAQDDVKRVPYTKPVLCTFSSQQLTVNPLLVDVILNANTALKRQEQYNTYKLMAATLDSFVVSSVNHHTQIVDDRVVVSCYPYLAGELHFAPIFVDVSCFHMPVAALKRAYLLTIGLGRMNMIKTGETGATQATTARIEQLNSYLAAFDNADVRRNALKQLDVIRRLLVESSGYYELLGERVLADSRFVKLTDLEELYGPAAILNEIRNHTEPAPTPAHPGDRSNADEIAAPSHLQLHNLMRVGTASLGAKAVNLTMHLTTKDELLSGSSRAHMDDSAELRTGAGLRDIVLLHKLSKAAVHVFAPQTPVKNADASPNIVIRSLDDLVKMFDAIEQKGDLNVYDEVEEAEECSALEKSRHETKDFDTTPQSTRQERSDDYSEEDDYPNTASGNLSYLKDFVAPYLQPALARCIINCKPGTEPEAFITELVQNMYTEFQRANPDRGVSDSSNDY